MPKPIGDNFNGPAVTSSRGLYRNLSWTDGALVRDGVRAGFRNSACVCMSIQVEHSVTVTTAAEPELQKKFGSSPETAIEAHMLLSKINT